MKNVHGFASNPSKPAAAMLFCPGVGGIMYSHALLFGSHHEPTDIKGKTLFGYDEEDEEASSAYVNQG